MKTILYSILLFLFGMVTTKLISIPEEKLYVLKIHLQTKEDAERLKAKLEKKYIVELEERIFE